jgi:alginate biosynthesis protein AlgX
MRAKQQNERRRHSGLASGLAVISAATVLFTVPPPVHAAEVFKCPRVDAGEIEGTYLKGRVYQGERGWFFRADTDIKEFFGYAAGDLSYIGRFAAALRSRGVTLVYMPVPPKGVLQPARLGGTLQMPVDFAPDVARADFEASLADWRKVGIMTVDILDAPIKMAADQDFFFSRDQHWRPVGARIAAATVRATLDADPDYAALPKTTYTTRDIGKQQAMNSTMLVALQRLCEDKLPQEKDELFETAAGEAAAGGDLLGGDTATPVALVGTSFSDLEQFNFVGFLEEALGLEVANYAISAGGSFTSILSYTHSDVIDTAPPKYLLWENSGYDRLDGEGTTAFRQMIPAVYGYCDGDRKLAESKFDIKAGGEATLPIKAAMPVSGHNFYLAMRAGDTSTRDMMLTIDHQNGDGEFFAITRSDRAKLTDRFFVEFSDDIDAPVKSVTIAGQADRAIQLTVQLCKAPEALK